MCHTRAEESGRTASLKLLAMLSKERPELLFFGSTVTYIRELEM